MALPEGKRHGAEIWEIPLVRVERCCIKGWFKRHSMRVHDTWFYFLPLCDTGQCIPCPFYGRQKSVTIKSISLWRAQVLGVTENPRYRKERHATPWTIQQNTVLLPHAALLALNNSQFGMVWTCLQFLTIRMGIINRGRFFSLLFGFLH